MSLIRRRRRSSKKSSSSSNPYANQGLDKFAVVLAELADKRAQLASHLGVPVSIVKFVLGSQGKWIPIVASLPRKKVDVVSGPPVAAVMRSPEMKIISSEDSAAAAGAPTVVDIDWSSVAMEQVDAKKDGENYSNDKRGLVWPEVAKAASLLADTGSAVGVAKTVEFRANVASPLARKCVFVRKWQAKTPNMPESNLTSRMLGEGEASGYSSGVAVSKKKRNRQADGKSTAQLSGTASYSQLQPTPPPELRIIGSGVAVSKPTTLLSPHETDGAVNLAATKQSTSRFKFKFLRETIHKKEARSASSTPRDSRRPSLDKKQSAERDPKLVREPHWGSALSAHTQESLPRRRSLDRRPIANTNSDSRIGELILALGLVIVLGALVLGQISAILGVLGWWYVVPCLRKALGDKPLIRSSHGGTPTAGIISTSTNTNRTIVFPTRNNKKITAPVGSSMKGDLQASEYKKKVIMDGLLHRGRQ